MLRLLSWILQTCSSRLRSVSVSNILHLRLFFRQYVSMYVYLYTSLYIVLLPRGLHLAQIATLHWPNDGGHWLHWRWLVNNGPMQFTGGQASLAYHYQCDRNENHLDNDCRRAVTLYSASAMSMCEYASQTCGRCRGHYWRSDSWRMPVECDSPR